MHDTHIVSSPSTNIAQLLSLKQSELMRKQILFFLPLTICAFGFLYCLVLSITPITRLAWTQPQSWIQHKLLAFGRWLPDDWHVSKNYAISHQHTGYMQLMIFIALAFIAYILCALLINTLEIYKYPRLLMSIIWSVVLIAGCIYVLSPKALSNDSYLYANYGRLLGIHHVNPYFVPPSAFPNDPSYPFVYWKNAPSIYGPVWTLISALLVQVAGTSDQGFLLTFRLFAFAMHLINIFLVTALLRTTGQSRRTVLLGTLLYAWNPLVLFECCIGAHNDVFMLMWVLWGIFLGARALQAGSVRVTTYALSVIALTLAALVKLTALPIVLFFIIALSCKVLRTSTLTIAGKQRTLSWYQAFLTLLFSSCISLGVTVILYGPFLIHYSIKKMVVGFTSSPSSTQILNSILFALQAWNSSHPLPSLLLELHFWSVLSGELMALVVVIGIVILWHTPTIHTVIRVSLALFIVFQLSTTWFFPWYILWPIGLAVISLPVTGSRVDRGLFAFTLCFSLTAFSSYYFTLVGWMLQGPHIPLPHWQILIAILTFGVPVCVGILSALYFPFTKHSTEV